MKISKNLLEMGVTKMTIHRSNFGKVGYFDSENKY